MLDFKNIGQKLQKSYVGKAGTIAKKEFGIFESMLFREISEKLEPPIRKNWSRPVQKVIKNISMVYACTSDVQA